jgi:hypothetical protein
MLVRRFKWKDSDSFGWGWCPAWMDNGDPVVGFGAAHDCLEHFPRCIGGFEGEMMAFGAMQFVRHYADWRGGILEAQRHDIAYFLENVAWQEQTLRDPGRVRFDDMPHTKEELIEAARKGILGWLHEHADGETLWAQRRMLPKDAAARIAGWMALGYHKARKRFAQWNLDSGDLLPLFDQIKDGFDRLAKRDAEPGEQIVVRVDFARMRVSVTRDYDSAFS